MTDPALLEKIAELEARVEKLEARLRGPRSNKSPYEPRPLPRTVRP